MKRRSIPISWLCLTWVAHAAVPNFVFILADDQAWNGTSVSMKPGDANSKSRLFQTPNLEKLAAQGMTFSQAYAAHCKCECSRASIQMGRTTTTLNAPDKRARNWSAPVTESLANTLKRADGRYRAAHFGKWQWFHSPESMGYDASDGITMNEDGDTTDSDDPKQSFGITRRAKSFMETQVQGGHPFYLQLSYYAVHAKPQALAATLKKYEGLAGSGGRGDRALMAAMVEDLDTCVGEVLRTLEELGVAENTFVIYMSDNGGRTDYLNGGKGDLGEGGLRVPLIVCGPGIAGGRHSDVPVISYDLTPTVLDFAMSSFVLPVGMEGGSWKPVLMGGDAERVNRPIERFVWHQAVEVPHPQSAIRKGDYKLLYFWDTKQAWLFDLVNDLQETHDLTNENPSLAAELQTELKAHVHAGLGEASFTALERGDFTPVRPKGKGKAKAKN